MSLLDKRSSFLDFMTISRAKSTVGPNLPPCGVHGHHLSWIVFFLVPVEHDNGMSISSGDVVCVLPTYVIVGCTPLSRYSVHQEPAIQYILALSSWLNNVFRPQKPEHLQVPVC